MFARIVLVETGKVPLQGYHRESLRCVETVLGPNYTCTVKALLSDNFGLRTASAHGFRSLEDSYVYHLASPLLMKLFLDCAKYLQAHEKLPYASFNVVETMTFLPDFGNNSPPDEHAEVYKLSPPEVLTLENLQVVAVDAEGITVDLERKDQAKILLSVNRAFNLSVLDTIKNEALQRLAHSSTHKEHYQSLLVTIEEWSENRFAEVFWFVCSRLEYLLVQIYCELNNHKLKPKPTYLEDLEAYCFEQVASSDILDRLYDSDSGLQSILHPCLVDNLRMIFMNSGYGLRNRALHGNLPQSERQLEGPCLHAILCYWQLLGQQDPPMHRSPLVEHINYPIYLGVFQQILFRTQLVTGLWEVAAPFEVPKDEWNEVTIIPAKRFQYLDELNKLLRNLFALLPAADLLEAQSQSQPRRCENEHYKKALEEAITNEKILSCKDKAHDKTALKGYLQDLKTYEAEIKNVYPSDSSLIGKMEDKTSWLEFLENLAQLLCRYPPSFLIKLFKATNLPLGKTIYKTLKEDLPGQAQARQLSIQRVNKILTQLSSAFQAILEEDK